MASRATKSAHVGMTLHHASVRRAEQLSPGLRRITLHAPTMRQFRDDGPDQRCKMLLPLAGQRVPVMPDPPPGTAGWYVAWQRMPRDVRPVIRTYTVRAARPEIAELDIDMLTHGDIGPGSAWATRARPGDQLAVFAAYAEYEPPPGARQVIVGDHCALPAVSAIVENLPAEARGRVVLEVPIADRLTMTSPPGVEVRWVDVADRPGAALIDAVTALPSDEPVDYAWVAGDSDTAAALRRHFVRERGLAPDRVMFMGYWRTDGSIEDRPG